MQGHLEGAGRLAGLSPVPGARDFWLQIEVPPELEKRLVFKGSVAIEGVSLTVANLMENILTVAIIPHTWNSTNLRSLNPGELVNIETDVVTKYLAKWSASKKASEPHSVAAFDVTSQGRYAVVVSDFNSFITDQLLSGALHTLKSNRVLSSVSRWSMFQEHTRSRLQPCCWRSRVASIRYLGVLRYSDS